MADVVELMTRKEWDCEYKYIRQKKFGVYTCLHALLTAGLGKIFGVSELYGLAYIFAVFGAYVLVTQRLIFD